MATFRARACLALALAFLSAPLHAAEASVASVEAVVPREVTLAQAAQVVRAGRPVPADLVAHAGLLVGDRIFVRDERAALAVRMLATGELKLVRHYPGQPPGDPDYVVGRQDLPGVPPGLFDVLTALFRASSTNFTVARVGAQRDLTAAPIERACPNPGRSSNEPARFRMPALAGYDVEIAPGRRRLLVGWRGGIEPYAVQLRDAHGAQLAGLADIRGRCSVTLPEAELEPGRSYSLIVSDGNGSRAIAMSITAATAPPAPPALIEARYATAVAEIYYAEWLALQEDCAWSWEAAQRVTILGCGVASARAWLEQHQIEPDCH